ncbi:M81 family metallopeptidase [Tumebacillus sp. ITR2]|uniref:M81 family metallopeptidase n=1 Tax=Tumebacillus amylolyticus TaxID=2801339 RepID=A0ABS1JHT7_9BACL|nr:M81 family metallopeptidase [Tumebacillus amylolyticus]MBL0389353.1 M81 family metallopeptidase [Tumebacillus amylolyticus]
MKKRIAVGILNQETNSFSPIGSTRDVWRVLMTGQEIMEQFPGSRTPVGTFMQIAKREGWELIPTLCAVAGSSGVTDREMYAWMRSQILEPIERERPDAVFLFLHGAMMAEGVDDVEGDLAVAVKQLIGDRPLLLEMDLHGNITPEMVAHCDGVFAYDTNPHVDVVERAMEAGEFLRKIFDGAQPVVRSAHPPMMPPTLNMRTAEGPMFDLFELAREWEQKPGIVNVSIFGGFPYCDFAGAGLSVVTTADGDPELAQLCSDAIAARAWEIREQFGKDVLPVEQAMDVIHELLQEAQERSSLQAYDDLFFQPVRRPVVVADVSDNPFGGGSSDTTGLLRELLKRPVEGAVAAAIYDPETVQRAIQVGVGGQAEFAIGGKLAPQYGAPLQVRGRVRVLTDGRFEARGTWSPGTTDVGLTAVIEVEGMKLVCTSVRYPCNDADLLRHAGIDPLGTPLIVLKSRGHFRASFEPLAHAILEVDAPGPASPDLSRNTYERIRRPIWPIHLA